MEFVYDDGGRGKYFTATKVGDCVTRAVAIATRRDYKDVYDEITKLVGYTPRNGVQHKDTKKVIEHFGGRWVSCMKIGSGCKTHLRDGELPPKRTIICNVSKHVTCIVNGVIHDTYDPSRDGNRCVYGYWAF